jgi:hypothetical protein
VVYKGETYYSIIDFMAEYLGVSVYAARNYYHVLKNRIAKHPEGVNWPIETFKLQAQDGKQRLTDCTMEAGLDQLIVHLNRVLELRQHRLFRQDSEVAFFHPKVMGWFEDKGYEIGHHAKLASGCIVDFIAQNGLETLVIECKPNLTKSKFHQAVGQVLCYCSEYGNSAIPVIATDRVKERPYCESCCARLGIRLLIIHLTEGRPKRKRNDTVG